MMMMIIVDMTVGRKCATKYTICVQILEEHNFCG